MSLSAMLISTAFLLSPLTATELTSCEEPYCLEVALPERNPLRAGGVIQAVIEIPAGGHQKWELNKNQPGTMHWEMTDNSARLVEYLGYPANYGAIPGTVSDMERGGDGDAMDVLVLGQSLTRGHLLPVRIIGMMRMTDGGEQDYKLIAVIPDDEIFGHLTSLDALQTSFSGVTEILQTWFSNYKGDQVDIANITFVGKERALETVRASLL